MTLTALPPFDFELHLPSLPETVPQRARKLFDRGFDAVRESHYEVALKVLERATQLQTDFPEAHYCRGVVLGQVGRLQEALDAFSRAIQQRPHFHEAYFNRGVALEKMGRHQEALEAFENGIQLQPNDPKAHYSRGVVFGQLGRYQEALEAFEHGYPLRRALSALDPLYSNVALVSILFGLSALKHRWLPDLEASTKAFIKWRARARRDKQAAAFKQAVEEVKNGLPAEDKETFEEFMLGVRLASIHNPFRRWEAIGKEMSKDWPEGVSAVEAVREQRRW